MIGGNVTKDLEKKQNRVLATNLVESLASLLDGEIQYSVLLDHKGVLKEGYQLHIHTRRKSNGSSNLF